MEIEDENRNDIPFEAISSEIEDSESAPPEYEISTYPADYTLQGLYEKFKSGDIIVPKFQRGFVWKMNQSSRLIESFMLGLPVPQIFVYADKEQRHLIIDGQQRLKSIFYFFEGNFGEPDKSDKRPVFRLKGLSEKSRWYNKTFNELSDPDKRKLRDCVLRTMVVKQLNPADETSVYYIFERLNTGGTLLKPQEVRNCVYGGKFNELLLTLNTHPAWRKILGKSNPDSRQKDVELILRYFTLYHSAASYKKPMKEFVSRFMDKNRNPSSDYLEKEGTHFRKVCDVIIEKLEERPFNPRTGFNTSVFDSVFLAFSKHVNACPSDIKDRYQKLLLNADYDKFTRNFTTDPESIKRRIELAEKILFQD
ncbi:MAG: DUF262 domain-containing protein [Candidatus Aenigmatarchaeota archaeon]